MTDAATAADSTRPVVLTAEEIRERLSGNLCRCGAYNGIADAVAACSAAEDPRPAARPPAPALRPDPTRPRT